MVQPGTEDNEELQKYSEFVAALKKLESDAGSGLALITLYIPPDKHLDEVTGHLKEEYTKADRIRDKETRTHVQNAISSILQHLKNYKHPPPPGMAIFCGKNPMGGDGTGLPCTIIEPVEPLTVYLYRCSSAYDLDPLKQMLDGMNVYGLLVLDVREAYWGFLRGNRVEPSGSATANVPGRQRKGGQSAPRFQRLREIAVNEFFTRVGDHASSTFREQRDFFKRFKGILIGGRSPTRENFLAGNYLHHEVRLQVIGVFEVARTDKEGLSELVVNAQDVIAGKDLEQQKVLMKMFHEELKNGGGLAIHGEESVRKHLATGSVGTLLLSASLRNNRFQITCQNCGHSDERTFQLEPGTSIKDILTHTCRICSSPIVETGTVDITEELKQMADHTDAKTVIIPDNFEDGSMFFSAYGGIGAILRYRTAG